MSCDTPKKKPHEVDWYIWCFDTVVQNAVLDLTLKGTLDKYKHSVYW